MTVQLHDWQTGGSVVSPVLDHDIVAMRVTGRVRLTQSRAGRLHRALVGPGNVTIHPRGAESQWSWDRPGAIVLARVPGEVLAEAADVTLRRAGAVELRNCFGVRDAFIEPILGLLARELARPVHPVQELISGCLSAALASHLVQRFNQDGTRPACDPGSLDAQALNRVVDYLHTPAESPLTLGELAETAGVSPYDFGRRFRRSTGQSVVRYLSRIVSDASALDQPPSAPVRGLAKWQLRRVTAYMCDHLDRDVSLDELARLVSLSRSHFCTAFRLTVGLTPREWLIETRIQRARELLANPDLTITEVAVALGYTPSAFGALFRERAGMTPSEFRRSL
jgi:AraC family transcriptional regulator